MSTPFYVLILGSGSAIPKKDKNHTSQVVYYNGRNFLLDCGEGTQIQLKKYGVSLQKIDQVFISHLHGDHYLGLPGLISSMNLLGRKKKLTVIGPERIREVINLHFDLANSRPEFEISYRKTQDQQVEMVYEESDLKVYSVPLRHKIPTTGFLFVVQIDKRKLIPEKLKEHKVPKHLRKGIAKGRDFEREDGTIIPNGELSAPPDKIRKYAYCSDTAYQEEICNAINGVDLLYHEASFLKTEGKKARENLHSTAEEAATIALKAGVSSLIIGHFSNKYDDENSFLVEARSVFKNTEMAREGNRYVIP